MENKSKYWLLILKFISGNVNDEEHRNFNDWINKHPENFKLAKDLEKIWQLTPPEKLDVDTQAAWMEFQRRQSRELEYIPSQTNSKKLHYILRVAAIVLVSIFTGIFVQYTFTANSVKDVSKFYVMQTFETSRGDKASITFSDGTQVILNSESSIRFPKEFHGMTREVYLDGEAYFRVAKNSDLPFIVYAKNVEVNVLGTEFNVQSWEDDPSVDIAVSEGEVAVSLTDKNSEGDGNHQSTVILRKGLYTTVVDGVIASPVKKTKIENHLMWIHGGLYFENEPFSKVLRDLERRFDVSINGVDSDLLDVPFTGRFQYADVDEVLDVIAASMNFNYRRDENEIKIYSSIK